MKYKVIKHTKLFVELKDLFAEVVRCRDAARDLVAELGFTEWATSNSVYGGGIVGFVSKKKPEGYKRTRDGYLFPLKRKVNAELLERIAKLPVVPHSAVNKIVGFKPQIHNHRLTYVPNIAYGKDFCLISISEDCDFVPKPQMQEITVSEYKILLEQIKAE